MTDADQKLFSKEGCIYTSCYCEENVFKLCENVTGRNDPELIDNCDAVFISNDNRTVPLWKQQKSEDDNPVVWDYHVILIHRGANPSMEATVYDLDTVMDFPVTLRRYVNEAIRQDPPIPQYRRMFRIIPSKQFLATFASDRSHMMNSEGGYNSPPPAYPCITTEHSTNNIQDFISMADNGHGKVVDLRNLLVHYRLL